MDQVNYTVWAGPVIQEFFDVLMGIPYQLPKLGRYFRSSHKSVGRYFRNYILNINIYSIVKVSAMY